MTDLQTAFADWLKTRPANVQAFAERHPFLPGDNLVHGGETVWFLGYGEWKDTGQGSVGLIVSPVNPIEDYDGAVAQRCHICPDHFE